MSVVSPALPAADIASVGTFSGNEITDATRAAAFAWPITQQGGSTDGLTPPAGVGVWEAATNLFPRGQVDAVANWNAQSGSTRVIDATVAAPFSPQSIKNTTDGLAANEAIDVASIAGLAAAAGTAGVGSVWFMGVAGQSYGVSLIWANTDASFTQGPVTTFTATGAFQLVTVPAALAVAAGKTGDSLRLRVQVNGTRAESFWLAHGMLQSGVSLVTPYIATSQGATAARGAARVNAPTSLLSAVQGWIAIRMRMGWASTVAASVAAGFPEAWDMRDALSQNGLQLLYRSPSSDWRLRLLSGGAVNVDASWAGAGNAFAAGDPITAIAMWATVGGVLVPAISVNGGAAVSATSTLAGFVPANLMGIGSAASSAASIDSDLMWVAFGSGTLSSGDVAALAALPDAMPGLFPPPAASLTARWMTYAPVGPKFRRVRVGEPVVASD